MRKILALIFILSCYANAQFGTVSGTITDGAGQTFKNGTYKVELVPAFGFNNTVRTDTGLPVTPTQVFGVLDNTGSFAGVVLTRTDFIGPAGALWKFTVCPDATSGCFTYTTPITTAAPSLTAVLSSAAGTIVVGTNYIKNIIPTAYVSTELFGMTKGSLYYNTTNNHMFGYDGSAWNDLTGTSVASCATVNNLCKSDGAGGFTNSGVVDTGSLVSFTSQLQIPDAFGATKLALVSSFNANTGLYLNNATIGLMSQTNGWISVANTAAAGVQAPSGGSFCYSSSGTIAAAGCDTFTGRLGAQSYIIGRSLIQASPLAYNFQVGENASGANVAGGNATIRAGNGTGTAGGGTLTFSTAIPHGSDSVLDTFTVAMTIDNNQNVNILKLKVNSSQALIGVQGSTGTNVAVATGSFTSTNAVVTDANGNFVDGGAFPTQSVKKEFSTVTAASSSGVAATTYFLNGQTLAANEMVAGSKFVFEAHSQWTNSDSAIAKSPSYAIGIDGTIRGASCAAAAALPIGNTGSGYVRLTMTVLTIGASGTVLFAEECWAANNSTGSGNPLQYSSTNTVTYDTTTTHTITGAITVPAVDTSSTGTNKTINGYRFN